MIAGMITAEDVYGAPLDRPDVNVAPLAGRAAMLHAIPPARPYVATYSDLPTRTLKPTTPAFVGGGAWRARCPTDGCSCELFVSPEDPRFFCPNCRLGWYTVVFPRNVEAIGEVLSLRPVPETRNWLPGESLDDLHVENEEHGL